MVFSRCIGNLRIQEIITKMLERSCLPNVMLFVGKEGIGKGFFAEELSKNILKSDTLNHPDFHILKPEGKLGMHSIAAVRSMIDEMALPPYGDNKKIFIIHDAERMLAYSSNALLKTLEEPPQDTIIILLASHQEALLPTVTSRCRIFSFKSLTQEEIQKALIERFNKTPEEAQRLSLVAQGSLGAALQQDKALVHDVEDLLHQILERTLPYPQLCKTLSLLCDKLDKEKKQWEEELQKISAESSFASVEKEMEGVIAVRYNLFIEMLFERILLWYRDMHLIQANGNLAYLIYPNKLNALKQRLEQIHLPSLQKVQDLLDKALTAFQRSIPLSSCLESLILSL
ncbi:MAG: hypothetical protein JHC93_05565 [Parachlamydiales bacterium]|nr:hypothetical protein [Parachlamydiales bacterium]